MKKIKWYTEKSKEISVEELKGKTILSVETPKDDSLLVLEFEHEYVGFLHYQSCCESVWLEDTQGNWEDIIGSPLLIAECVSNGMENSYGDTEWTFYRFATEKGFLTLRFIGESNGSYSTDVELRVQTK